MAQIQYETKEIVVREGDPGYKAYVVVSGKLEMVRQVSQGETQLGVLTPGMCFGEATIVESGTPYAATVRALERSILETLNKDDLDAALKSLSPSSAALVNGIISRFHKTFVNPEDTSTPAVSQEGLQKIVVAPGSDLLARQFKDVVISPTSLPFRIGGFPAENATLKNRHNHLNIASDGPPLVISRQHCEISSENDGLYITDLASRFNTVVNGKVIGRGRGQYQAPLIKGKNDVMLGGMSSPYKIVVMCE